MIKQVTKDYPSVIVIGDIHGCYKTLMALIAQLPKDIPLVFCGDLIDRGPDSKSVVDFVKNNNHYCVSGNHEDMMVKAEDFWEDERLFLDNGGIETRKSYGETLDNPSQDYKDAVEWMKSLPVAIEFMNVKNSEGMRLLVSHSSAHGVWGKLNKQNEYLWKQEIMWNRLPNIRAMKNIYNVFGHTPQSNGPRIKIPYANIDTGCVYDQEGYGKLTALQFPEMIVYQQDNIEEKV